MDLQKDIETGKIEIKINTDSNGERIDLENLSLEASKAFLVLLDNFIKIAEVETKRDGEEIKLHVEKGSLRIGLEASPKKISSIQDNFLNVINNNRLRESTYVNYFKKINSALSQQGYEYEAYVYYNNKTIPIRDYFSKTVKGIRSPKKPKPSKVNIEFLSGKLQDIGGKKNRENFHIETVSGAPTIKCSESLATDLNRVYPIYSKIFISAWNLSEDGKPIYQLCDFYTSEELFVNFREFVKKNNDLAGTERLEHIHDRLAEYYTKQDFRTAAKFIQLYNHSLTDVSRLRSILLISKAFKNNESLTKVLSSVKSIVESKIKRKLF